jgi:hypothetical protein
MSWTSSERRRFTCGAERAARTILACAAIGAFCYFSAGVVLFGLGLFAQPGIRDSLTLGVIVGGAFGLLRSLSVPRPLASAAGCVGVAALVQVGVIVIAVSRAPDLLADADSCLKYAEIALLLNVVPAACTGLAALKVVPAICRGGAAT